LLFSKNTHNLSRRGRASHEVQRLEKPNVLLPICWDLAELQRLPGQRHVLKIPSSWDNKTG
jgi:hypothetical protein